MKNFTDIRTVDLSNFRGVHQVLFDFNEALIKRGLNSDEIKEDLIQVKESCEENTRGPKVKSIAKALKTINRVACKRCIITDYDHSKNLDEINDYVSEDNNIVYGVKKVIELIAKNIINKDLHFGSGTIGTSDKKEGDDNKMDIMKYSNLGAHHFDGLSKQEAFNELKQYVKELNRRNIGSVSLNLDLKSFEDAFKYGSSENSTRSFKNVLLRLVQVAESTCVIDNDTSKDLNRRINYSGSDYNCLLIDMTSVFSMIAFKLKCKGDSQTICYECGGKKILKYNEDELSLVCDNEDCSAKRSKPASRKPYAKPSMNRDSAPVAEAVKELKELDEKIKNNEGKKEGFNMNMNKIFGGKVGKVEGDQFRLGLNGVAIKNDKGDYVVFDGKEVTNVSDFVVDANDIFYRIPAQTVKKGDLIIYHDEPLYVREVKNGTIKVFNAQTDKLEEVLPQKSIFGFNFFIKVVSMFNMDGGAVDMQNMMIPMMLMSDGDSNMDSMLPLLMMSNMGQGSGMDMNSMLPFMLMGDKKEGKGKSMLPLLMMMQNGGLQSQTPGQINPLMFMMMGEDKDSDSMIQLMMMQNLFAQQNVEKVETKGGKKVKIEGEEQAE